jgi:hypothetical protein
MLPMFVYFAVVKVCSDVSVKHTASIFRATERASA